MSPVEWLHFITPFIVITIIISLIACVPVTRAWRQQLQLPKKPLAFKKVLLGTFGFIALGWMLAWVAPHIMTPLVRVNVMATSQLILTIALVLAGLITLVRLFQRNNLLSILLIGAKRHAPIIITVFAYLASGLSILLMRSFAESKGDEDDPHLTEAEKEQLKSYMNYRGDYCDKHKSTWYFD
jgi:hypothetical protein